MPNIDPYATNVLNGELAQDAVLEEAYNTVDGWEIGSISIQTTNAEGQGTGGISSLTLDAGYTITLGDYYSVYAADYETITGAGDYDTSTASTLYNYGTIEGGGTIWIGLNTGSALDLINEAGGVVDATGGYALDLATYGYGPNNTFGYIVNQGTLESTAGAGGLAIDGLVDNAGGLILANGAGTHVDLYAYVYGGELETLNGGVINAIQNAILDGTNLTGEGAVTIAQGTTIDVTGGLYLAASPLATDSIINQGTIEEAFNTGVVVYDGYSDDVSGTVALSGGGSIVLDGGLYGGGVDASVTSLDNIDNTISGSGNVTSLVITNEVGGVFDADGSTSYYGSTALTIGGSGNTLAFTNSGLLEATGTGQLVLNGGTFDNTNGGADNSGQILANGASAEVNIASYATVIGGTLSSENGGEILVSDGVLDGTQTGDPVNIEQGTTLQTEYLTLEGTIDNAGTIQVEDLSRNEASTLSVDGTATLQGSGNVVLADVAFSNSNGSVSIGMPTLEGSGLDLEQELQGSGQIFVTGTLALTNDSTIDATDAYALSIEGDYPYQLGTVSSTVVNLGTLESTGTGGLDLNHIIIDNTQDGNAGQIIAGSPGGQSDPQVVLGDVDIEGGTLTTYSPSDLIEVNGNTVLDGTSAPVTISADSNLDVVSGGSLALDGSIVNEGTITLDGQSLFIGSNGSDANATVTLSGGGTVALSGSDFPYGYIEDNDTSSGTSLTLDNVDNTIAGAGTIDVDSLINEQSGTIDATGSDGLWISGPSVTNMGLLEFDRRNRRTAILRHDCRQSGRTNQRRRRGHAYRSLQCRYYRRHVDHLGRRHHPRVRRRRTQHDRWHDLARDADARV